MLNQNLALSDQEPEISNTDIPPEDLLEEKGVFKTKFNMNMNAPNHLFSAEKLQTIQGTQFTFHCIIYISDHNTNSIVSVSILLRIAYPADAYSSPRQQRSNAAQQRSQ